MPTRNVVLTEYHEQLIEELVTKGRYQNASEVLREGLRLVERQDQLFEEKLLKLREAVAVGLADLDRGDYVEFSDVDDFSNFFHELTEEVLSEKPSEEPKD